MSLYVDKTKNKRKKKKKKNRSVFRIAAQLEITKKLVSRIAAQQKIQLKQRAVIDVLILLYFKCCVNKY